MRDMGTPQEMSCEIGLALEGVVEQNNIAHTAAVSMAIGGSKLPFVCLT